MPENVVTNDDLKEWMETSDEWIQERTGIQERRWIDPATGETTSTMAVKAAKEKGYEVLLLDSPIVSHLMQKLETSNDNCLLYTSPSPRD